jgi:hypothetical protein
MATGWATTALAASLQDISLKRDVRRRRR